MIFHLQVHILFFFQNHLFTSAELTALTFEDKLALGAAKGKFNFFNKFLVTGCFGNLTAKVFFY
jgi:hypothetical protein